MEIVHIENNFNKLVEKQDGIAVVDFWATWCGPCKMFGPIFENVASKYSDIKFYKFDVDNDTEEVCKKYGIMSIPTIILFKNGKEIKKHIGFMNEDDFSSFLEEI